MYAVSFEYVRRECLLDFRSLAAPTVSGFCGHHDRRRKWKCCSSLLRKKHLTEKSNLPYKPNSSRGGSEQSRLDIAHQRLPTWISPAFNGRHAPCRRSPGCTRSHTTRYLTMRPSSFRLKGLSVSERRKIQRVSDSTLTQAVPAPALTTSPERAEAKRRSRPCGRLVCPRLGLFLRLMLLTRCPVTDWQRLTMS